MTRTDRHIPSLLPLLLLSLAACGGRVDEDLLTGTWAHTRQVEVRDPLTGRPVGTLRSDVFTLSEDSTYQREYQSTIPGEEEQFSHKGRWYIRGRTLKLSFTKEDSSLGKVKGKRSRLSMNIRSGSMAASIRKATVRETRDRRES